MGDLDTALDDLERCLAAVRKAADAARKRDRDNRDDVSDLKRKLQAREDSIARREEDVRRKERDAEDKDRDRRAASIADSDQGSTPGPTKGGGDADDRSRSPRGSPAKSPPPPRDPPPRERSRGRDDRRDDNSKADAGRDRRSPRRSRSRGGGGGRRSRSRGGGGGGGRGGGAAERVRAFLRHHRVTSDVDRMMCDMPADPTAALCDLLDSECRRERRDLSMRTLSGAVERLRYLDRTRDAIAEASRALSLQSRTVDAVRKCPFTFAVAILASVDPIATRERGQNADRIVDDLVRAVDDRRR